MCKDHKTSQFTVDLFLSASALRPSLYGDLCDMYNCTIVNHLALTKWKVMRIITKGGVVVAATA